VDKTVSKNSTTKITSQSPQILTISIAHQNAIHAERDTVLAPMSVCPSDTHWHSI